MTPERFEELTDRPLKDTAYDCHGASLQLVQALRECGDYPRARVARGSASNVGGQHSWVVLDGDCYAEDAAIIDPTIWVYWQLEPFVWTGTAKAGHHSPHGGMGTIWSYGRPPDPDGEIIPLAVDPGRYGRDFLRAVALTGLDAAGWHVLLHAPVRGWPSREIISAAYETPRLRSIIPVDIVGMLTDHNPGEMYW